ncbi:MAG TPA: toll/interleukin-1 receptor domain-containing protein [Patescibacteria group bacterium]|nr:toll/interleukin-1 receptor domain-containing protein [Patescibacteria group bacterium]
MTNEIFVSYAAADRSHAEAVAHCLTAMGRFPVLDEWCLAPCQPSQTDVDAKIEQSSACLLLIGPSGAGPAQSMETRLVLARQAARQVPVVAILLPGADLDTLPPFLHDHVAIDLRQDSSAHVLARALRHSLAPLSAH